MPLSAVCRHRPFGSIHQDPHLPHAVRTFIAFGNGARNEKLSLRGRRLPANFAHLYRLSVITNEQSTTKKFRRAGRLRNHHATDGLCKTGPDIMTANFKAKIERRDIRTRVQTIDFIGQKVFSLDTRYADFSTACIFLPKA
jgi:hypothetical protein